MQFTSKQLTIIIVAVCAMFITAGVLTYFIGKDADSTTEDYDEDYNASHGKNKKKHNKDDDNSVPPYDANAGKKKRPNFDDTMRSEGIDVEKEDNAKKEDEKDPIAELDELIGLEAVKAEVKSLANTARIQKMREDSGLKTAKMSYHLVFTGSPGTGKTTVARIVARVYKDLGILKKGHLVETDRSGLIGQYVGQTAPKVNHMCDSALNGVLFIDEAYALTQGGSQGYGDEAVATLLKRMEDDRDKLVVIVAGYTNEMKDFINTNPGLQSRFNRYINFPDYTAEELTKIFDMYLKKNEYAITSEAHELLKNKMEYAVAHKDKNFGNARYVRNVFEKAITCQANRVATLENPSGRDLYEITYADVKEAFK